MTKYTTKTITSVDDTSLYLHCWTPDSNDAVVIKANVVVVHGYLEHGGRYAEVADYLCNQNFAVTALDCRGHGKSSGQRAHVGSYDEYIADLKCVLREVHVQGTPLFVLAHSNGALITLHHFCEMQSGVKDPNEVAIKGVVLTSPWLAPADELPAVKIWASKILGVLVPRTSMPADEVSSETVTRDPHKQQEHRDDPLILDSFTLGWARLSMKAQAQVLQMNKIPVPLLIIIAGQDKVANTSTNTEFAEQLQQTDKTVVVRKENYHEVLNEVDRQEVYDMIANWMEKRLK